MAFGAKYVYAVVFTAVTIVLLNKLNASTVKLSRYLSRNEIARPIRKSIFVKLGRLYGLRASQDARPPVGLANVLTSAPVKPPSPES